MHPCQCGCGTLVRHRWVRGHQFRAGRGNKQVDAKIVEQMAQTLVEEPAPAAFQAIPVDGGIVVKPYDGPPAHPASIDHRRWSLAVDRPNTSLANPWIETKCHNCLGKMWTRDPQSTWEYGGICETCDYTLRNELSDYGKQQLGREARAFFDPFKGR